MRPANLSPQSSHAPPKNLHLAKRAGKAPFPLAYACDMVDGFQRMESLFAEATLSGRRGDPESLFEEVFGLGYALTTWKTHYKIWEELAPRHEINAVAAKGYTAEGRWKIISAPFTKRSNK